MAFKVLPVLKNTHNVCSPVARASGFRMINTLLHNASERIYPLSKFQWCPLRQHQYVLSPGKTLCASYKYKSTYQRSNNLVTPIFLKAEQFPEKTAIVDELGVHTYGDLMNYTEKVSDDIVGYCERQKSSINGARMSILCPNNVASVAALWGIWKSGGVAVSLCKSHPPAEWKYFLEDSQSRLVITTEEFSEQLEPVASKLDIQMLVLSKEKHLNGLQSGAPPADEQLNRRHRLWQIQANNGFKNLPALIIYTSGTTGPPKGVVHTFGSLHFSIQDMVETWEWTSNDVILHVLPLHHIHGVVNALMVPLYCGATCVMQPSFNAEEVWSKLLSPVSPTLPRSINVFMAVPTIYAKLIEDHEKRLQCAQAGQRLRGDFVKATCSSKIRLMVSGSAALPRPILDKWKEVTGHTLLERYGMTETLMCLTNPLHGNRIEGSIGNPFPSVEVRIARHNTYASQGYDVLAEGNSRRTLVTPGCEEEPGELLVKGPSLFKEFWNKPEATASSFTKDGWFKTGDTVVYKDGVYSILGRTSVDVIKSGGYKISALDVERHLLVHDDITDVAVVGLPDITWGQKVAAVVVVNPGTELDLASLKAWALDKMPRYQIPTVLKVIETMPRNSMGKVNKKNLVKVLFPQ